MILQTKFNIGDTVWYTKGFSYSFQVSCKACATTGKIITNKGLEMKCGECAGSGEHRVHRPFKIRPQKGVIKNIEYVRGEFRYGLDTLGHNLDEKDLLLTFFDSRKAAHEQNKEYGWPKENFDRWKNDNYANISHPDRCYWGVRLRKSLTSRNVND